MTNDPVLALIEKWEADARRQDWPANGEFLTPQECAKQIRAILPQRDRERETYDGLVRDAMLWRKRQIAATDTQSKAQPQHFVETEDPHTLKCKCGFLCVTQDMMRVHIRYPEAKLPDDLPDLDVTFLAAQPQTVDE